MTMTYREIIAEQRQLVKLCRSRRLKWISLNLKPKQESP